MIHFVDRKMAQLVRGYVSGKSPLFLVVVTDSSDGFHYHNYTMSNGSAYAKLPKGISRVRQLALSFNPLPSL